jgi:ABC-type antimicrobial peptide transport system permease subunit
MEEGTNDIVMKYSDYAKQRDILGYKPVTLKDGEFLINCITYREDDLKDFFKEKGNGLDVNGHNLKLGGIYTGILTQNGWTEGNGMRFIIVAPDDVVEGMKINQYKYVAMANGTFDESKYTELYEIAGDTYIYITGKDIVKTSSTSTLIILVFPIIYMSFMVIMVAATILSTQMLSDVRYYRHRYKILKELGMGRENMLKTLKKQLLTFFLIPAVPPIIMGCTFVGTLASNLDDGIIANSLVFVGLVLSGVAIFAVIYAIYIIASYFSFKRSVLN